jgi:anti-sigma factor RsiW
MACQDWQSDLRDWALDELSPEKARQLEQHIEQCAECGRAAHGLREVRQALLSSLTDQPMPAHLVLVGDKPKGELAGFWAAFLRTAALSSAAAAIFLAVVSLGFRYGGSRLLPTTARVGPSLTRAEVQAYVTQAVTQQASLQREEVGAATDQWAADLRQEHMRDLARIARQLDYLQLAQNTVWEETQRQNEVINLVAQNRLEAPANRPQSGGRR